MALCGRGGICGPEIQNHLINAKVFFINSPVMKLPTGWLKGVKSFLTWVPADPPSGSSLALTCVPERADMLASDISPLLSQRMTSQAGGHLLGSLRHSLPRGLALISPIV